MKTTTTVSDSTVAVHQIQVSTIITTSFRLIVKLDNGDEINLLPYGIQKEFRTKCLIGNGVVIDPKVLLNDFHGLTRNGIDYHTKTILSSRYAFTDNNLIHL